MNSLSLYFTFFLNNMSVFYVSVGERAVNVELNFKNAFVS
jgi:hypothetical protein